MKYPCIKIRFPCIKIKFPCIKMKFPCMKIKFPCFQQLRSYREPELGRSSFSSRIVPRDLSVAEEL